MNLKTPIKVNLWGHEAAITSISWRGKFEPWHSEDEILVWFDLPKSAYGTSGFVISLPVKDYGGRDFLEAVIREGEKALLGCPELIAAHRREEQEKQKQEEERKKELDTIVQNIVNRLSGE
jgi:hypothetical protein